MARVANVNIPDNKRVCISLTYIYGIGFPSALKICKNAEIPDSKRVKDLSDQDLIKLRNAIREYKVEGDLRREITLNIKKKIDINSYAGIRHRRRLPVRGQRTHSNARTRKGKPSSPITGKKKATR